MRAAARALLLLALAAAGAGAQRRVPARSTPRWELRADGIAAGEEYTAHLGAGLSRALGTYARLTLVAGAGVVAADDVVRPGARLDALVRLTADPFAEHGRAPYVGAGVSARGRRGAAGRTDLLVVVGVDGRPRGRWAPALELGLGGGARVGLVLRRVRDRQR